MARPKQKNKTAGSESGHSSINTVSQVDGKLIFTSDGSSRPLKVPKLKQELCNASKAMGHSLYTISNSHRSSASRERMHAQGGVFDKVGLGESVAAQAGLARSAGGSDRARQMVAQSHAASGAHSRAPRETKTGDLVASGAIAAVSDPNRFREGPSQESRTAVLAACHCPSQPLLRPEAR